MMDVATLTLKSLGDTLSPDDYTRTNAELQLKQLTEAQEYAVHVAQILASQNQHIATRQITLKSLFLYAAGVALGKYVNQKWSLYYTDFKDPPASQETKAAVKQILLQSIADPQKRVRVASAYVVSKIARSEWPDEWPDLVDQLIKLVKSNEPSAVHGSMRVLTEFIKHDLSDDQFIPIAQALLPEMLRLVQAHTEPSNLRTSSRGVAIFCQCVETLFIIKDEHPQIGEIFMRDILPKWLETFVNILALNDGAFTDDEESRYNQFLLKSETVKTLSKLASGFAKNLRPFSGHLLRPVFNLITSLMPLYAQTHIEDIGHDAVYDSDGNELGIDTLLCECFELLTIGVEKRLVEDLFVHTSDGGATEDLKQGFYSIQDYMRITVEDEENWSNDAERYVVDEEVDSISYNVRIGAQELATVLVDKYDQAGLEGLWAAAQQHLADADLQRSQGGQFWWKTQEATMTLLGNLASELIEASEEGKLQIDLANFLENRVGQGLTETSHPFLQGRSYITASQFASFLPDHVAPHFVEAAVSALEASQSVPVKISAVRALHMFARKLSQQVIAPYQARIIQDLGPLVQHTSANTLMLLLDALSAVIAADEQNAAVCEPATTPVLLDIWYKNPQDPLLNSTVSEMLELFAKNPQSYPALCQRVSPVLIRSLDQVTEDEVSPHAASAAILLSALIRGARCPLPPGLTASVLPSLLSALMKTGDRDLLQDGAEVVQRLIVKDTEQVLNTGGAKSILDFIAKLLNPDLPESGGLFVGDLTVALLRKAQTAIAQYLPDLLGAVARRLEQCETATYAQGLVVIFAQLIVMGEVNTVVTFLKDQQLSRGNGLEALLTVWCENYNTFQGHYNLKVSAIGLSMLFESAIPEIAAVLVKGDIKPSGDRIVTRSRSKRNPDQFEIVSAPIKMIKLLVEDLQTQYEQESKPSKDELDLADQDDGDDDWEDLDGGGEAKVPGFGMLSDMLDEDGQLTTEEDDDEDLQEDPIYQTNLLEFLIKFFKTVSMHNTFGFQNIYGMLTKEEKMILGKIIG